MRPRPQIVPGSLKGKTRGHRPDFDHPGASPLTSGIDHTFDAVPPGSLRGRNGRYIGDDEPVRRELLVNVFLTNLVTVEGSALKLSRWR